MNDRDTSSALGAPRAGERALSTAPVVIDARTARCARVVLAGVALCASIACDPIVDEEPPAEATPLPVREGTDGSSLPVRPHDDDPTDPGATCVARSVPLRRISHIEHRFLLRDLFPPLAASSISLATDLTGGEFENARDELLVNPLLVDQYHALALEIAEEAVVAMPELVPCDPALGLACAETFIRTFGRRALRAPLSDDDVADFRAIFEEVLVDGAGPEAFTTGVQLTIQAMLESPEFLYRIESGTVVDDTGAVTDGELLALDGPSLANRLSFLLWSSAPDDELIAHADDGTLLDEEVLAAEVERMLDDPRARESVGEFFRQWLDLERISHVTKVDPAFTPSLQAAMREETRRFLLDHIFEGERTMDDLLTSSSSYVNAELATHYGVAPPSEVDDEGFGLVTLPDERSGFLTQGSFLAGRGHPTNPSPVLRGVLVLERLLCIELGTPPPGAESSTLDEGVVPETNRQAYELLTSPVQCTGCHQFINPVGFALEGFDSSGRARSDDNGAALDLTGSLLGSEFDGAKELGAVLAALPDAERCLTDKIVTYAFGAHEWVADSCLDVDVEDAVTNGADASLKGALRAVALHPEFRFLRTTTGSPAAPVGVGE